jgi:alkanesulfonate monooxygenase SsuD/methylene tetrahydromethanopterin reductase-like flavin-dependent oxidoreductase (luciferase family)
MEYGAHLPLIDFDGRGWRPDAVASYARTAQQLGFRALAANDHLVFQRPWLDGIVALASVVEASGDLTLATTASLPVVRGPSALAKAAAALDILSGGRLALGVGPGSSRTDYALVGVSFEERWPRFEESIRVLRAQLSEGWPPVEGSHYPVTADLEPRPTRPGGPPIWIGSWGSEAGLRRVARLGDGWLASAYNTTPERVAAGIERLQEALAGYGRSGEHLHCTLATMWTWVTDDAHQRDDWLARLAAMLNRPQDELAGQLLVGPAEACADVLRRYAAAGVDLVCIWPVADPERQLERFMQDVVVEMHED